RKKLWIGLICAAFAILLPLGGCALFVCDYYPAADTADKAQKRARSAAYVDGLLENGGPPTNAFKKTLGEDATAKLFREVLFKTGKA
ncbi:MAG: hypothetical protein II330_07270, partial [Clostridia bacterium]|nr:hypothetical protein [Clostridia bacterium]